MKAKISSKLDAINEELELRQEELENVVENYSNNMASIEAIDKTTERLHESILNLTVSLEKQVGETNVVRERIKFLKEQNNRLALDIENYNNLNSAIKNKLRNALPIFPKQTNNLTILKTRRKRFKRIFESC